MELTLGNQILLWGFGIAVLMGAVVNKTNFCTMGSVSDWVNMNDTGRLRAWVFAVAVAILGVLALELFGYTDMSLTASNDTAQPPYRTPMFVWPRYVLGGLLFGIGMSLGSGCGSKTFIRIGGGNLKSVVVVLMMGIAAYIMLYTSFDHYVFLQWMNPLSPNLTEYGMASQDLGSIVGGLAGMEDTRAAYITLAAVLGVLFAAWCFRAAEFRTSFDNILGGTVVGLAVVGAWAVTAGPMGQEWLSELEWLDVKPHATGVQSYTFVAPSGQMLHYAEGGFAQQLLTFAMVGAFGVVVGSFLWAVISRGFRFEWFNDLGDAVRHVIGGLLMGVGGVLAMGCTIGQAVTGASTLALGSFLAFGSIVLGSALTMKIQYYKMLYEAEASFGAALVSSLVDFRLLPRGMRRLEAM
ncbi:YeeE/YedE family protein [Thiohalobacter thiocyanaticus]|uniref:YeeE/YedE family protein n=1 Tax=Thiohalobacter thiocyanaticus TaxID=585455 RepID=A0A426QHE8_9GAMM|nr:YeeE/YedE family protein [Thiohalobacter thiocyanaticus]RRQ21163.1 YeeE/YedE family protein [Thiohalobacter thiocyanaticus]